jgi:hypothetical protein
MPATKRIEPPGEASETKPRPHPWPGPMIYTPLTATKGALLASIASSEAARTVEALALWRVVFGDERGILHIWTGIRDADGNIPSATIRFDNFAYPSAATSAAEWALAKSDEGREVYFCAHLLASTRPLEGRKSPRVKENAATLAAFYAELDGAKQAWVADGGSEAAFEKVWPEIRDELHRRRVLDADEQARLAQRGTGVSRI